MKIGILEIIIKFGNRNFEELLKDGILFLKQINKENNNNYEENNND